MEGKGGIQGTLLTAVFIMLHIVTSACMHVDSTAEMEISVCSREYGSKALMPDEEMISDMSLLIYDIRGNLEYSTYIDKGTCRVNLLKGKRYTFCACINFGYRITAGTMEELMGTFYHMAYPDEYKEGMPMCALLQDHLVTEDDRIILEPERLMSKISIRMDRSRLSEGIRLDVTAVRIGNCPKKVKVFGKSRVESEDDCFNVGFSHSDSECTALNRENAARLSESITLYMLENMQGRFSEDTLHNDEEKVFKDYDIRNRTCSFIVVEMDYLSPEWTNKQEPLKYRFYLGEDRNSLDVERNSHYRITISPEDDGLHGDGWRVDKSSMIYTGETSLIQYPKDYIVGKIGERIHIGCTLTPAHTPFDVGEEYMKADKETGIYDYEIDPDGHGATLTLTGTGRGLIYMEAGAPINDAALFLIEVNQT